MTCIHAADRKKRFGCADFSCFQGSIVSLFSSPARCRMRRLSLLMLLSSALSAALAEVDLSLFQLEVVASERWQEEEHLQVRAE